MKFIIEHSYYNKRTNKIECYETSVQKKGYGYAQKIENCLRLLPIVFIICVASTVGIFCFSTMLDNGLLYKIILGVCCFTSPISFIFLSVIFVLSNLDKYYESKEELRQELCKKELEQSDKEYQQAKTEKEEHQKEIKELCRKVLQEKDENALFEIIIKKYNTLE